MAGQIVKLAAAGLVALSLGACVDIYQRHGYVPTQSDLENVIVGVDSRDTVLSAIGQPATAGLTRDETWYYVESTTRARGPLAPEEIERRVIAVSFDSNDTVANIEEFGLQDGNVIALNRRISEGGAQELSFIRQLLGNAGNFNAAQALGSN
ncbi:outer membrane protein assembly factor BamE [Actibacterium sp. XHP0104]|uniref:outer membrane protein assembly factor BamE n=1 Tax=Actibacterium sp. XHP0104 TaxID=2984335 RepID=UPI0021E81518|nr:outer membrane protein assembly factor BamE [Actibacterium sp. XHP0104]MCV2881197.1 outer membrane protein assembly factor BamE [Actibacterium sp. XHP0104]